MTEMQKRQPAYVVDIKDLTTGEFVKTTGGWDPNFIITDFGLKVSRTTVFGTVVESDMQTVKIDDSTDIIEVRSFEDFPAFEKLKSGDFVMIIGKVREFNNKIYLSPEICSKVDNFWISYKNKTKQKVKKLFLEEKINQDELKQSSFSSGQELVKEIVEESISKTTNNSESLIEKVLNYIDEEDKGDGVEKVKILDKFNSEEIISVIQTLTMEGDIFEIKPGIFKVLK